MKKITLTLSLFLVSVGLMNAQEVQLPAAYSSSSVLTMEQDMATPVETLTNQIDLNVTIPFTGTYGTPSTNATSALVYDNGPYFNQAGSPDLSILETTTLGMNSLGAGAQFGGGNSVADDVVLTDAYNITTIDVYSYQTGATAPSITAIYLQVYDGDPSGGGSVIWGDLTTDILDDAVSADAFRVSETDLTGRTREIQMVTANTSGLTLPAGTYWIEYSFEGSGTSGPWAPPIAILGEDTTGNALQNVSTGWVPLTDSGTLTPQGLPFQMYGTPALSVNDNVLAGFNFYPNPTSDMLNLSASKNIASVSLFNVLGQEVLAAYIDATTSNINLSDLSSGIYIMKVNIDGQVGTYKIMKK